ncbi:hypothetical protein SAMN05660420_02766 [Desulfuromusa kysingii]|uniref:Uncharacterized protein n=1 Tax=Desulfuromusa kysingii TaxID=37625 RepID=A0A1H4D0J5_9BACT|nr:hypothetical protein [Desulfuromusa kysingii]SEA66111.1 hypothetical protein SAMN05660420_02766 [Desulfuromusa kysingii]
MNHSKTAASQKDPFNRQNYEIRTLEDEIRADNHCKALLQHFHAYLLNDMAMPPLEAGSMASGADYYLRDYMIDHRRCNIFEISAELVHSFAGNWYIINTIEPNMGELESVLIGIRHFYRFCVEKELVTKTVAAEISQSCGQTEYYQQRIESFNAISGDGYIAWNKACPLRNRG